MSNVLILTRCVHFNDLLIFILHKFGPPIMLWCLDQFHVIVHFVYFHCCSLNRRWLIHAIYC